MDGILPAAEPFPRVLDIMAPTASELEFIPSVLTIVFDLR